MTQILTSQHSYCASQKPCTGHSNNREVANCRHPKEKCGVKFLSRRDGYSKFQSEDWSREPQYLSGDFNFARADGKETELLLPVTKIQSWATGKAAARKSKGDQHQGDFYEPILDKHEFRVMELKPGAGDEDLRGALLHCSVEFVQSNEKLFEYTAYTPDNEKYTQRFALSTNDYSTPVQYTALSYTWGPDNPSTNRTIDCAGHKRTITESLAEALKQFRQKDHSILLWVDQICINQKDDGEKKQQIPLMSSIYRYATNTAIWLGAEKDGSTSAMKLLDDVNARLQFSEAIDINPKEFLRLQLPQEDSTQWRDLKNLLKRPWFSRLWIIQEVILSRSPWVLCGDHHEHWSVIENGCHQLQTTGISNWLRQKKFAGDSDDNESSPRRDLVGNIMELSQMKSRFDTLTRHPRLLSLLISTRNAQCFDHRDKVYGLHGICSEEDKEAVHISYDKHWSVAKLYHDMTVKLLRSDESITSLIYSIDHDSSDAELPSWVPDWRLPRETTALGESSSMLAVYKASGELPKDRKPGFNYTIIDENNKELYMRGTLVHGLCQMGDVFTEPDISYEDPPSKNQTLLSGVQFVNTNLCCFSAAVQEVMFTTFWHTLVAGQDADGMRHCPESFAEIFSLLLDESTNKSPSLPGQTYSKRQKLDNKKYRLALANLETRKPGQTFQEIRKVLRRVLRNRRLGILGNGLLGLFPRYSRTGDMVYAVVGCIVPILLRPVVNMKGKFQVVGECYVHGIMQGEALDPTHDRSQEIILV